jgi:hypothetical protein
VDVSVGAVIVLGGLVFVRFGLVWFSATLLLRPARECPACFQPTALVRRPLITALLPNAEWRWCLSCAWQGPARKLENDRWTRKNVKSQV